MRVVWLSGPKATFYVTVDESDRVVHPCAPIALRFLGENLATIKRAFNVDKELTLGGVMSKSVMRRLDEQSTKEDIGEE